MGMPEARWRHVSRARRGFATRRYYYEMLSTCSIMLFRRLSRYLALYSRLIDAEVGQNATRHLSITPRLAIFSFSRRVPDRRHDGGQGENVEGKGCRLAFVEHANARVRKREREGERERNSFLVREWAVRCRGRRWSFPLGRSQCPRYGIYSLGNSAH